MKWIVVITLIVAGCGLRGRSGSHGVNGTAGSSCSVSQAVNGAVITCTDGSGAVVYNGEDAAQNTYAISEIIQPCPTSGYREVILRLQNGQLLAHYSHGNKQFLTLLIPGSYQLTDGSSCHFTVHPDLSVSW